MTMIQRATALHVLGFFAAVASLNTSFTYEDDEGGVLLPKTLVPLHYEVRLRPFVGGNFSVHGTVKVLFTVRVPTHHVVLHMADIWTKNDTTKVTKTDSGVARGILRQKYVPSRMLYVLDLREELVQGGNYTLSLDFVGSLGEKPRGFYRSSYTKENGERRWMASTQFQSTDARRAFPCFDEPGLKATFKIFLAREGHMTALSNMPLMSSDPIEGQDGWFWDEFDVSVPMSTYLVAFAITDFPARIVQDSSRGTVIRVVTRASVQRQTRLSGDSVTLSSLRYFETYFETPFPLPKIDLVAVPENSFDAMENWGLITFRESALLYDPELSSAAGKQYTCYLVSHELAHQWFGNLVTMAWWTDLWLNEGFATYMGEVAVDNMEPSWGVLDQFVVKRLQQVMALDALRSSHPVSVPVIDPDEINEIFDIISYSKGASIIRMMKHFLTENTFRKGLKNYLTERKYKNAEQDDLWRYLTEAAHQDGNLPRDLTVKTIMDTWTLQMGYPVLTVAREGNSSAVLSQDYFLMDRADGAVPSRSWWIPVTYTTQVDQDFDRTGVRIWFGGTGVDSGLRVDYPGPHRWAIFNVRQTGYYRVNYDEANWALLTRQLQEGHEVVHVTNRAQIIDDALNLARAGRLSYGIALGVLSYLSKEKDYVPWKAALNNLQYLRDMFHKDRAYGALKEYLLSLLLPAYDSLGFQGPQEEKEEDLQTQMLRAEVVTWACNLGHRPCRKRALRLFRAWMAQNGTFGGIAADVTDAVLCTAIREGGEEEWNFAWRKNREEETSSLFEALACTEETWLLARYLEGTFNPSSGIRRQNSANTFRSISAGPYVGNHLAWNYLRNHWNSITDYVGATFFALPKMVEDVTKTFNTPRQLQELADFRSENEGRLLTAERAVEQAIEATEINVLWMERNRESVVRWLSQKGFSSELSSV